MKLIDKLSAASEKARPVVVAILRSSRPNDIDDALQNALLKAWLARRSFEKRSQLSTWFTRIAINEALMLKRGNQSINAECPDEFAFALVESRERSPEQLTLEAERSRALYEAISQLSKRRKLAALEWLAGAPLSEAAEVSGSSFEAAKAARHCARVALRGKLEEVLG